MTPITMSKMFQERAKKIRVAYDFETGVLLMQNAFGEEKGDGAVELKSKIDALLDVSFTSLDGMYYFKLSRQR